MTKLLVSPRSVSEARVVSRADVDIVDVKNPAEGSLGANFPWIISEIKEIVPPDVPVSAAIGDFPNLPGTASLAALGALEAGADIVKVGLMGPENPSEAVQLVTKLVRTVEQNPKDGEVVACGYADFDRSGTIEPLSIPRIAREADADYAMLDTGIKDGKSLTDFLTLSELIEFTEKSHSSGLKVALAGSLGLSEISDLLPLQPDVIGVRGAVCKGSSRECEIKKNRIDEISEIMGAG